MTAALSRRQGWRSHPDRGCDGADPDWFDDTLTASTTINEAKKLCYRCPVRTQCLDEAIHNDEPWGIWGGWTANERARIKAGMKPRYCPLCGAEYVTSRNLCNACFPGTGKSRILEALLDQADRIAAYVQLGYSDTRIAEVIGDELGCHIAASSVVSARRLHRIRLGVVGNYKKQTYDPINVDLAEAQRLEFGKLTWPEQVELMRRWLRHSGRQTVGFSRAYRCSWERAAQLRDALPAMPAPDPPMSTIDFTDEPFRHYRIYDDIQTYAEQEKEET